MYLDKLGYRDEIGICPIYLYDKEIYFLTKIGHWAKIGYEVKLVYSGKIGCWVKYN